MDAAIIPIVIRRTEQRERLRLAEVELREHTFAQLDLREVDIEEFVRRSVGVVLTDETLLIVGQQVLNRERGRCDLVAIDDSGAIVLIELKRDAADMRSRVENLEFQAVRYAANYALIDSPQSLVQQLLAPYVERHRGEFGREELTPLQLATEILDEFLEQNDVKLVDFNRRQRIILIASSYDPETLSACAWLAQNGIEITCVTLSPFESQGATYFVVERTISLPRLEEYFVGVAESGVRPPRALGGPRIAQNYPPRMSELFAWGILHSGDTVYIRNHPDEVATVINQSLVRYHERDMRFNEWGQTVTGWSSINIYKWTVDAKTQRTLDDLRREKTMDADAPAETVVESKDGGERCHEQYVDP